MIVTFWGARGSYPMPGPATVRYGGNTSCVSIELNPDKVLVLDAGTGILKLGKKLASSEADLYLLLTHLHWDHIQGFPFFAPLYIPDRVLYLLPYRNSGVEGSPFDQTDSVHFPLKPSEFPARCHRVSEDPMDFLHQHGIAISRIRTNHPGGAYGYRIEQEGKSLVFIPDNELVPPGVTTTPFESFVDFCQGADVLVHDAQYLEGDMPAKWGWGHSLLPQACELAVAASVKHLVLFHHDPSRTDDELDEIQTWARAWLQKNNAGVACTAAFEGLTFEL